MLYIGINLIYERLKVPETPLNAVGIICIISTVVDVRRCLQ